MGFKHLGNILIFEFEAPNQWNMNYNMNAWIIIYKLWTKNQLFSFPNSSLGLRRELYDLKNLRFYIILFVNISLFRP